MDLMAVVLYIVRRKVNDKVYKMVLNADNLLLILAVGFVNCVQLPAEKCQLEDSDCLTRATQSYLPVFIDGIPELGVDVMDVMDLNDVAFDLAGLQFTLKEGKLKGLRTAVFDKVKWDTGKKKFELDFHANTTIRGHYTASGRILILPITGDGNLRLKMRNIAIKITIPYEMEKNADGKDTIMPKKYSYEFDVIDNVHYELTNLFNGNKELSDTMLTFLNANWKQISKEFGGPIMDSAAKTIFKNIQKFLSHLPAEDIASV